MFTQDQFDKFMEAQNGFQAKLISKLDALATSTEQRATKPDEPAKQAENAEVKELKSQVATLKATVTGLQKSSTTYEPLPPLSPDIEKEIEKLESFVSDCKSGKNLTEEQKMNQKLSIFNMDGQIGNVASLQSFIKRN